MFTLYFYFSTPFIDFIYLTAFDCVTLGIDYKFSVFIHFTLQYYTFTI